jgi:hypothetical protein
MSYVMDSMSSDKTAQNDRCALICLDCQRICSETISFCLQKGDGFLELAPIQNLLECVQDCKTTAGFLLLGSNFYPRSCSSCADSCLRCAEECEQHDYEKLQECAEICRKCAEACREVSLNF